MMEMLLPCMTWVPLIWDQLRALFISFNTIHDTRSLNDGFVQCDTCSGDDFPDPGKNHGKGDDNSSSEEQAINKFAIPLGHENEVLEPDPSPTASSSLLDIPDDIIIDILSRLCSESVLQCQRVCKRFCSLLLTPIFTAMHFARATPILVVQTYREHDESDFHARVNVLHFIDQYTVTVASRWYNRPNEYQRILIGSYNGLLLFRNEAIGDLGFFIWNPITQEEVSVMTPDFRICVCGIFFHAPMQEYRLIYFCHGLIQSKYFILSLRTKLSREIANRTEVVCRDGYRTTIINGVLHWMVSEDLSTGLYDTPPCCSKSIMTFNINSEEFLTMPHPGEECCSRERHTHMQLLEMDGHLCLFDTISSTKGHLWVLENYEKQVWVKAHTINVEPLIADHALCYWDISPWLALQALYIYRDELLLQWNFYELIYYDLKLSTFRKGERGYFRDKSLASVVVHTDNFAYVQADACVL